MIRVSNTIFNKDKKLKKFYDGIVSDISVLRNKDKGKQDQEQDFIKDIITKEDDWDDKPIDQLNLTMEEKCALINMKKNTFQRISKTKFDETDIKRKLNCSLAYTEDEIFESIEWSKSELFKMFEENSVSSGQTCISDVQINEKFALYLRNPYLKKPFKSMLNEVAEKTQNNEWCIKHS